MRGWRRWGSFELEVAGLGKHDAEESLNTYALI